MIQSFKKHFFLRYRNCRNWPALCLAYWLVCFVLFAYFSVCTVLQHVVVWIFFEHSLKERITQSVRGNNQ